MQLGSHYTRSRLGSVQWKLELHTCYEFKTYSRDAPWEQNVGWWHHHFGRITHVYFTDQWQFCWRQRGLGNGVTSLANFFCQGDLLVGVFATAMGKIFGTSSCLRVKYRTAREFYFLFFRAFLLVLIKSLFWEEDCALGYNSMEFWDFPALSQFPNS